MLKQTRTLLIACMLLVSFSKPSLAGVLDSGFLNASQFSSTNVPQNVSNEVIKMFGVYTAHRPFGGATSIMEANTLDIVVEATMVKVTDGINKALIADGMAAQNLSVAALPVPKISLRKGLNERADIGFSGLIYQGQKIYGGDIKILLYRAEEGLSYALRLGYTYANIPKLYVQDLSTFTPEIVMSQKMSFAEPYLGAGFRYMKGKIDIPVSSTVLGTVYTIDITGKGSATTAYAFTGVYFRILGAQGLRIGMEGSFDLSGYHTMGIVAGLGF